MSNIYTSYVRIKRRDGEHITPEEMDYLFSQTVLMHEEFGSYWVRIVKKYRKKERCLDIQYGSGKSYGTELDEPGNYHKYYIVERRCDEGYYDSIWEYQFSEGDDYARYSAGRDCKFGFDQIKYDGPDSEWFRKAVGSIQKFIDYDTVNTYGEYYCGNHKAFVDLHYGTPYYGPCLQYSEDYPYDYFVLVPAGDVQLLSPLFIVGLAKENFDSMPEKSVLTFLYKLRPVLKIEKIAGEIRYQTASYWDNCADEIYLKANPPETI